MIQCFNKRFMAANPGFAELDREGKTIELKVMMPTPFGFLIHPGEYRIIGEAGDFIWAEKVGDTC